MKAIIPVAGAGTRLRPHTYTQPKALIPVAGKPIIAFIIEDLKKAGIKDFVFVIGYLGDKIRQYVEDKYPDINAYFAVQAKREGVGHAIWSAREFINPGEEILIVLGDTIVETDWKQVLKAPSSMLGIKKVDDPRNFGVAELNGDDRIVSVVEKPKFPKSNMALIGVYRIRESKELFGELQELVESEKPEGEIQLTDAIMQMIGKGVQFKGFKVDNWYDCGRADILLKTNATLLKKTGFASEELMFFENTVIKQPVSIAHGARISNSIIGPNVTVGEDTVINNSVIRDSIVGSYTQLEDVVLKDSVIGSDAMVRGFRQSLNIGDNTAIDLRADKSEEV